MSTRTATFCLRVLSTELASRGLQAMPVDEENVTLSTPQEARAQIAEFQAELYEHSARCHRNAHRAKLERRHREVERDRNTAS